MGTIGAGPPLLLVNGVGANIEMWQELALRLPGRRLVMFDFPGTGESPPLRRRLRMPALAHLVAGLLDRLDIETADVLGYSWGGVLAQQRAHQAPHRVRSLVLAATIPGVGGQPPSPWVVAAMATPLRYHSRAYLRLVAPLVYGVPVAAGEGHVGARQERPPKLRGYAHQLYAIQGWSSRPWLRDLRAPTLVPGRRG
ncbi:MAG: alpha/beta hydrolase [Actinomycetota bacterium]|nr:alpha/beta hydrolase [Actinomycetota bacterium]